MGCEIHHYRGRPNQFSDAISKMANDIQASGFTVRLHDFDLPPTVAGRIDYATKTVRINSHCAGCATIALAHEFGHLNHFLECGHLPAPPKEEREKQAAIRGLKILRSYGISESLVTNKEWSYENA